MFRIHERFFGRVDLNNMRGSNCVFYLCPKHSTLHHHHQHLVGLIVHTRTFSRSSNLVSWCNNILIWFGRLDIWCKRCIKKAHVAFNTLLLTKYLRIRLVCANIEPCCHLELLTYPRQLLTNIIRYIINYLLNPKTRLTVRCRVVRSWVSWVSPSNCFLFSPSLHIFLASFHFSPLASRAFITSSSHVFLAFPCFWVETIKLISLFSGPVFFLLRTFFYPVFLLPFL